MFHVSKSWKESKNSGAVFGKCFHRSGCGLVKNKGFKITENIEISKMSISNLHIEICLLPKFTKCESFQIFSKISFGGFDRILTDAGNESFIDHP